MDSELDLKALFETLRRQIWRILIILLTCVLLAFAYLYSSSPVYTASALIMVDPAQRDLLDPNPANAVSQSAANARVESEVEILRSDYIAMAVVREADLLSNPEFGPKIGMREKISRMIGLDFDKADSPNAMVRDAVNRFRSVTTVRRIGLTYLIEVSVASGSPQQAADLTNKLAATYIDTQVGSKIQSALAARDVLQSQIEASQENLANSEVALDDFVFENVQRIESETGRTDLSRLLETVEATRQSRLETEVRIQQLDNSLSIGNWTELVIGLEDTALSELERQRATLEGRLGRVVADSDVQVDLRAELFAVEQDLRDQAVLQIGSLRSDLAALGSSEDGMRQNLRNRLVEGQLPPNILTEVFAIQQNAAIARSQYQTLLSRLNEVEARAGTKIADSRIVSPALEPASPSAPKVKLVLGMSVFLGSILGIGYAFIREFIIGGITSPEQLQAIALAPVVTTIPHSLVQGYSTSADIVINKPLSHFAESIRQLRASIDHAFQKSQKLQTISTPRGKVVLVTSAVPAEGKTTTALALARTYAVSGASVLLIDADLRKPSIHLAAGNSPSIGFIDFLEKREKPKSLADYCFKDSETDVMIAPGNSRSKIPTDGMLQTYTFQHLLTEMREIYDVIIIDTPPLLSVVDGRYVAPLVDVAVMLVRWASTSQSNVKSAMSLLTELVNEDAPILLAICQSADKMASVYMYNYGEV